MDAMPDPLEPAQPRKVIRNAAWLVAWDEAAQFHCYHRDVDLAIEGETLAVIGPAAPTDHSDAVEIDGRGFGAIPPCQSATIQLLRSLAGSPYLLVSVVRVAQIA